MDAPAMPDPMITVEAVGGRKGVERRSAWGEGGDCQYEIVGCGVGRAVGGRCGVIIMAL